MDLNWLEWMWIAVFLGLSVMFFGLYWFMSERRDENGAEDDQCHFELFMLGFAMLIMPYVFLRPRVNQLHDIILSQLPAEPASLADFTGWAAIVIGFLGVAIVWISFWSVFFDLIRYQASRKGRKAHD